MTAAGFARILAAALPGVPAERLEAAALLCRRYAGAQADAGVLEAEARALPGARASAPQADETPIPETLPTGPKP